MLRPASLAAIMLAMGLAAPAIAAPPQDGMPLSQIIQSLEQEGDVAYFDEIEWDDDGYWEVEYYRANGAKVELKIDPKTGKPRGR